MNASRGNVRDEVEQRNGYGPEYGEDEGGAALAIRADQSYWTERQVAALSALGIRGATPGDLQVFMHYCLKTGLDPFARQIYLIKRRTRIDGQWVDRQTIQVGIDGFRVVRDRLARERKVIVEYGETVWYDDQGSEHKVWVSAEPPAACKVTIFVIVPAKDGQPERRLPFRGVVRFESYADRKRNEDGSLGALMGQWAVRGEHMIAKCAEALALRTAFPQDLSGVYTEEELAREAVADGPPEGYKPDPPARGTVRAAIPGKVTSPEKGGRRRSKPEPEPEKTGTSLAELFDRIGVEKTEDRARAAKAILGGGYDGGSFSPEQARTIGAALHTCIEQASDAPDPETGEIRTPYDNLTVLIAAAEAADSPPAEPSPDAG